MTRPRWTTRRIMATVAVLGLGIGLGRPAVRAANNRVVHRHGWSITPQEAGITPEQARELCGHAFFRSRCFDTEPFGVRYWRDLLGIPPAPLRCREARPHPDETCSLEPSP